MNKSVEHFKRYIFPHAKSHEGLALFIFSGNFPSDGPKAIKVMERRGGTENSR